MFESNEIIIAQFPFSSLESSKRRPCLILAQGDSSEDFIVAFITSSGVPAHFKYAIKLSPLEKDFLETGLKVESFIRIDKIAALNLKIISGSIGKISLSVRNEINLKLKLLFNL